MKRILQALIAVLALTATAAQAQKSPAAQPIEVDRVVAVVNDEAITLHELRSRLATVERQLRGQGTPLPPRDVFQQQLLERMIIDRVQVQFARETGLRIADGEVDAALRRIAESNRMSLADFKAAIEHDGIVWAKFREEIREEMTIARLRDREVDNRIVISEGEIDNYLASAEAQGGDEQLAHLAHIIVRVPEQATPQQLAKIRARAEQALQQLRAGEDFAKIAAVYSDAPDALTGGSMGARPVDRLPSLYADAVKDLKPGEVSGLLRSPAGFHVVKLLGRQGGALAVPTLRQTHARHILIKVNELVSESEARHKLQGIRERLVNGGDFAELARLYSNDLSASKGGDLGWLYQGDTVPDFEKAMDALKLNEFSKPVQSPFGFHLIQVLERRTEGATPERRRLVARAALRERKADEAYQDWIRQMRDRAYVEYRLEDR
ncbi:MAG: peptidylprolyl isomerase [Gammaproteobacteria bacterium]|nr:peptidylprolyl isomerase [Gammaproteobacteria bacterium]MBU1644831.1 peptidylprolyl isomerase [Gammaproteobacteria bacterium]MBU1973064.1 peptidylprolyl isomerase [Gammaproteobacteria bacterium]